MADESAAEGGRREGRREGREGGEGREGAEQQSIVPNVPLETGVYSTTTVIEGLRHRYPVPSFLRDTFFGTKDYVDSDVVQADTYRGGKGLAPYVLPLEGQVIGRRRPFTRSLVEAPIIAPARTISLREARKPGWGENPYNYRSPE